MSFQFVESRLRHIIHVALTLLLGGFDGAHASGGVTTLTALGGVMKSPGSWAGGPHGSLPTGDNIGVISGNIAMELEGALEGFRIDQTGGQVGQGSSAGIRLKDCHWTITAGTLEMNAETSMLGIEDSTIQIGGTGQVSTFVRPIQVLGGNMNMQGGRFISGNSLTFGRKNRFVLSDGYVHSGWNLTLTEGALLELRGGFLRVCNELRLPDAGSILRLGQGNARLVVRRLEAGAKGRIVFVPDSRASLELRELPAGKYEELWKEGLIRVEGSEVKPFAELFSTRDGVLRLAAAVPMEGAKASPMLTNRSYSLEQLRQDRQKAAWKKRRIIYNNDGNEALASTPGEEISRDVFIAKRLGLLPGTQVDSVFYGTNKIWGVFSHPTRIGDEFNDRRFSKAIYHKFISTSVWTPCK